MNNFVFHSNFHRSNHHTVSLSSFVESAKDPIASFKFPFFGIFYNNIFTQSGDYIGSSDSYIWWHTYTTTKALSTKWNLYPTTYTTVCSNSAFWNNAYDGYTTLYNISSFFDSTFDTLCANIVYWNAVYDPYTLYTNQSQEYTKQKNFEPISLNPVDPMNIVLDLSAGQFTTYYTEQSSYFQDFVGNKRGGIYHISLVTNTNYDGDLTVFFNPNKFKFPNYENKFFIGGTNTRMIQFLSDGEYLHGTYTLFEIIAPTPTPTLTTTPTPTITQTVTITRTPYLTQTNTPTPTLTPTPTETPLPFIYMKTFDDQIIVTFGGDGVIFF